MTEVLQYQYSRTDGLMAKMTFLPIQYSLCQMNEALAISTVALTPNDWDSPDRVP